VLLSVFLACSHAPRAVAPGGASEARSRWLLLELAGQPVGRTHELVEPGPSGALVTTISSELRFGRLGKVVEMATDVRFEEDGAGVPRAVRSRTTLSRQTTTAEIRFTREVATIEESAGGPTHTREVALQGPLLGPQSIRRLCAARLRAPGDSLDYATWSPVLLAPQRVHVVVEAVEPVTIDGTSATLLRVKSTADGDPSPQILWLDSGGVERRVAMTLPFGTLISSQADREPQLATGELPADFFEKSLVRSNVRLPGPRALERLEVRLTLDEAGATRASDLTIERVHPGPSTPGSESVAAEFLGASVLIDPTEPEVRAIAEQVTRGAATPWEQAQRLTSWVSEHMTFDAGVAFAPAGELARARHGTCAGYAGLLASLLRAARIPARFVLGLVYVSGVFAGHAWVEAYLGGQWVPLDSALPSEGPADAARIAVARDSLTSGAGAALNAFGKVIGHAQVTVLGYTAAGQPPVKVGHPATPYTLEGTRYSNPGLGFSLAAPPGYRFTDVDAVWPDTLVVGLEGPGGSLSVSERNATQDGEAALGRALELAPSERCEHSQLGGRDACVVHGPGGRVRLAVAADPTLFVVEASGPDSEQLLRALRLTSHGR
jgi:hypothetical protein